MKKLNLKLINRDAFCNQRSYEAALYAANVINGMLHASKNGSIILNYENVIKLDASIELDNKGSFQLILIKDGVEGNTMIVGDVTVDKTPVMSEHNTIIDWVDGKIHCTKRDIREFFKLWRVCRVINVIKATDLA